MKKTIFTLVALIILSANHLLNAKESLNFTPSNSDVELFLIGLDLDSVNNRGISLTEISEALGNEESDVNKLMNNIIFSQFSEKTKVEITSDCESAAKAKKHYVVIEKYDVEQKGYPYDNFLHAITYSVYNSSNERVLNGRQQFATLDCIDKKQLEKQVEKIVKKVVSKIS